MTNEIITINQIGIPNNRKNDWSYRVTCCSGYDGDYIARARVLDDHYLLEEKFGSKDLIFHSFGIEDLEECEEADRRLSAKVKQHTKTLLEKLTPQVIFSAGFAWPIKK